MEANTRRTLLIRLHNANAEIARIDHMIAEYPLYAEARDLRHLRLIYQRYCRMLEKKLTFQQPELFTDEMLR